MYIFLDIDGVLVKEDETPINDISLLEADVAVFDPICLNTFETVIRQYPETNIVISSAWRETFSLEEIKSHFSADIAAKIVGVTPIARSPVKFFRYFEVLDYLKNNKLSNEEWIAIDDFAEHFPKHAPLILTNRYRGFDKKSAETLAIVLANTQNTTTDKAHLQGRILLVSPDGQVKQFAAEMPAEFSMESEPLQTSIMIFHQQGKVYFLEDRQLHDGKMLFDVFLGNCPPVLTH